MSELDAASCAGLDVADDLPLGQASRTLGKCTRVLMLTCQFMPDVYGGAEKQCQRLARALHAKGVEVTIVTSRQHWHADHSDPSGVRVKRFFTMAPPDLLGRWLPFSVLWTAQVLGWGWLNRKRFDVVHCHQGKYGAFVGCLLGTIIGKPVLVKVGNSQDDMDFLCLKRKWLLGPACLRFILKFQPKVIAISSVIEENLRACGFKDVERISNGVDTKLAPPSEDLMDDGKVHLYYHGRLEPIKQVDKVIQAFDLMSDDSLVLHILGAGSELQKLKCLAASLGSGHRVQFHEVSEKVLQQVARFDVFVNASRSEGFSNSLLESLVMEKVLVSSNVSGASDAINEGVNGFVTRDESIESLADCMSRGVQLHRRFKSGVRMESQRKIQKEFDIELIAGRYQQLYREL